MRLGNRLKSLNATNGALDRLARKSLLPQGFVAQAHDILLARHNRERIAVDRIDYSKFDGIRTDVYCRKFQLKAL